MSTGANITLLLQSCTNGYVRRPVSYTWSRSYLKGPCPTRLRLVTAATELIGLITCSCRLVVLISRAISSIAYSSLWRSELPLCHLLPCRQSVVCTLVANWY